MINFKFQKTKKNIILLIVLALSVITIGVSFAFFAIDIGDRAVSSAQVGSETPERLEFRPGDPISLYATQSNFIEGGGSLIGSSMSSATLYSSESLGSASEEYQVYFDVVSNDFTYTHNTDTPEMLLTVIDPNGDEVLEITGLTHKTVVDASGATLTGFDITTYEGLIKVKENYAIETTDFQAGTTQEWTFTVTYVNLVTNQALNAGKRLESEIILQKEIYVEPTMANYLIANQGEAQGLLQHTSSLTNGAGDDNYRYSGSNSVVSNNWVCFGSDEPTCPEENKYRIIGIYDGSVKLIKATAIDKDGDGLLEITIEGEDTFVWDEGYSNDYETSDIKAYLNGEFYNSLPASYQSMIKETIWNVGGNDSRDETAYEFYRDNIGTPAVNKISTGKIGLVYPSDYGYAAHTNAWTTLLSEYHNQAIKDNNWLFNLNNEEFEWTIAPNSSVSNYVWYIYFNNKFNGSITSNKFGARPAMYLESSVKILSGTGSEAEPFRIGM